MGVTQDRLERLGTSKSAKTRPRYEPPWPADIPDGDWFAVYPTCMRVKANGEWCKVRPCSRGNFYCGEHGGCVPQVLAKAKERYLMWLLLGEPFLNPDAFEVFVAMFLKRMLDRIDGMTPANQIKLLEIAVDLINEGDGLVNQ